MAGIDSIVNTRADAFTNNPQGLMQRYAMGQDLLDLLALQKLKQDKEAAARSLQMNMQTPQGTIKDQLQGQVMDMTKREVAQAVAPGLQQQGQRMQAEQMQQAMGAGLPTQPAPALQGMAQGGIVGYANGGPPSTPYGRQRAARLAAGQRVRDEIALNEELYKTYAPSAGLFGLFKSQTDEERARAQEIMDMLPNLNYADKLALAATGQIPSERDVALALDEDGYRTPPKLLPLPDERPSRPAPQPTTQAAPQPTTQAAPTTRPAITAPTEEGIAALFNDMTARAQQPVQQPKYRSRYEDRLAEIEAEKQDRMGALIDFLQAAGASGGTNLGATLMGGGSGLRAREERLRQQETDALKSIIEDEQAQQLMGFRERELAQQAEQNALNRSLQERIAAADRASQEGRIADEIASRKAIAKMQIDEAVKRAEIVAGTAVTQAQIDALKDARESLEGNPAYNAEIMDAQKRYKNDPIRLATTMQSITDLYLNDYLAPVGLSTTTFEMTRPAPTE